MQSWGKAVAAGGEGGSQAMNEIAVALQGVDDQTKKNALGVGIFGTLYEDQGQNIINTLINAKGATVDLKAGQDELNNSTAQLNADPAIMMQKAIANLTIALTPLLLTIAGVVSSIAEWIINNPNLTATIVAVVTTLSILIGIAMGLAPIFTAISSAAGILGISMAAIAWPVTIVVAAIAALIAIGVLLYRNWDEISAKAIEIWGAIQVWLSQVWEQIKETTASIWNGLKEFLSQTWDSIKNNAIKIWNSIGTFFTQTIPIWIEEIGQWFLQLPNKIAYALGFALATIIKWCVESWEYISTNVPLWIEGITTFFSQLPANIWTWLVNVITNLAAWGANIVSWITTNVPNWISGIVAYFAALPNNIWTWLVTCVDNIRTWGVNMLTEATIGAKKVFDGVVDTFVKLPAKMLDIGKNIVAGIKEGISSAWEGMTSWIGNLCDDFVDGVKEALDIHSPSRVMMKLGAYTGEGFGLGIQSTIGQISRQAQAMADAAIPNVGTGSSSYSSVANKGTNAGINQTVNIYSPLALSPSETAKQNKRVLQELALAL
jgi:hypothetical protein